MPHRSTLRRWLVGWLYAAAAAHLLVGLAMTWLGDGGLFSAYHRDIAAAFWPDTPPAAGLALQHWWFALFGATLQAYAVYLGALVHLGNRSGKPAAWGWLIAGILLWAPQDIALSLQQGALSHLWADGLALFLLLPPLAWLYAHDRRAQTIA